MRSPRAERPRARVAFNRHASAWVPYARALAAAGHEVVAGPADVFLCDLDLPGPAYRPVIDAHLEHGAKVFLYPHGTSPVQYWDGITEPYEPVSGAFVIGEGHAEVYRMMGYRKPQYVVGWGYCEILPFRSCGEPRRVLFGPAHPLADGSMTERNRAQNRRVYEWLLEAPGIELTVRHIQELERNGLYHVPGVEYVRAEPDGSHADIDRADVVVSAGTFADLAIARGVPTVKYRQDERPSNAVHAERAGEEPVYAKTWDRWRPLYHFPFDVDDGPAGQVLAAAAASEEPIREWKRRWIGEPLEPRRFSRQLEWALALARRPETRDLVVLADADEVVERPRLLEAYSREFGPDDDATLVLLAHREDTAAVVDELQRTFAELGLHDGVLPDLLLVPRPRDLVAERALVHGARAVLSEAAASDAFAGLPRRGAADVGELRHAA